MSHKSHLATILTKSLYGFFGSWLSVVLHAIAFTVWLVFKLDINTLTMWVSLEAIFLSIFILMAENQEQAYRDAREKREKQKELQLFTHDIATNDKALNEILYLKEEVKELKKVITILLEKK